MLKNTKIWVQSLRFVLNFVNAQKYIIKSVNLYLLLFYILPRKDLLTHWATVKIILSRLNIYYLGWIYITLVEVDTISVSPDQETVFPLEQGLENFPWINPNLKGVLTYLNKIINIWDALYIFNREIARFRNKIKRNSIPGVECLSSAYLDPSFSFLFLKCVCNVYMFSQKKKTYLGFLSSFNAKILNCLRYLT